MFCCQTSVVSILLNKDGVVVGVLCYYPNGSRIFLPVGAKENTIAFTTV